MSPRAAVTILITATALSACGTASDNSAKEFSGDKQAVADVIEQLETAGSRGEAGTICTDIIAKSLRDQIAATGGKCEEEMDRAIEDADNFELTVKSVTISGTKATARVEGSEDDKPVTRTFELVKEGTRWRATSFGGS